MAGIVEAGDPGGVLLDRGGDEGIDDAVEGEAGAGLDGPAGEGTGPERAGARVGAGALAAPLVPGSDPDPGGRRKRGDEVVRTDDGDVRVHAAGQGRGGDFRPDAARISEGDGDPRPAHDPRTST